MRLFIDCEWNTDTIGQKSLISMALVPIETAAAHFYQAVYLPANMDVDPWVEKNVLPKIGINLIPMDMFQKALQEYLQSFHSDIIIIADWPEDIEWLCKSLILAPGKALELVPNIKFEVIWDLNGESINPHNALQDAFANRQYYLRNLK